MKHIQSLIILIIIQSISSREHVKAQYDDETNTLIYNESLYTYSGKATPEESLNVFEEFIEGFWFNFIGFTILAVFAGAMSGLTVGYLSVDLLTLEIKIDNGEQKQVKYAQKIRKVIADHHWILVTLLLCNAFACEAMPILLDKLVSEMMAIVISVTVLLFVGEIVPQALCTGPNQLRIASFLAPFTYCLMIITYPLSYPIAKFMDCVVGKHETTRYDDRDLKSLIDIHMKEKKIGVNLKKFGYFTGFLDTLDKTVTEVMKPVDKINEISVDDSIVINEKNINNIVKNDSNVLLVYHNNINNILGSFEIKKLIGKTFLEPVSLEKSGIQLIKPIHVSEHMKIIVLFEKLRTEKGKIAVVHMSPIAETEFPGNKEDNTDNKEPLLEGDDHSVVVFDKSKNLSKDNLDEEHGDIEEQPVIGIVTYEDLNDYFFKIHVNNIVEN